MNNKMIHEYPEIYESFKCVGGKCPDSCCIGWEVDIDEESYYYYMTVKGDFGERLKKSMKEEDGERFFPLNENGRCPFLNSENLCDIYSNLGEDRLCTVCTEYPRYYEVVGDYEQIDMSLSCIEYGKLYFDDKRIKSYKRTDDGLGGEKLSFLKRRKREKCLRLRDSVIDFIEAYEGNTITDFIADTVNEFINRAAALKVPGYKNLKRSISSGTDFKEYDTSGLNSLMKSLEVLDKRWTDVTEGVDEILSRFSACEGKYLSNTDNNTIFLYKKLMTYFVFRYTIETYFSDDVNMPLGIIEKSMYYIYIMCISYYYRDERNSGIDTFTDLCHIYSREVEHSDDNLNLLWRA